MSPLSRSIDERNILIGDELHTMRPVYKFPQYWVSADGRIYSDKSGRLLRPSINNNGRRLVVLYRYGHSQGFLVHRLVYEAWIGPLTPYQQVSHKNGDRTDNRVENLKLFGENRFASCRSIS